MRYYNMMGITLENNEEILVDKLIFSNFHCSAPLYKAIYVGDVSTLEYKDIYILRQYGRYVNKDVYLSGIKNLSAIHNQKLLVTVYFNNRLIEITCDALSYRAGLINPAILHPISHKEVKYTEIEIAALEFIEREFIDLRPDHFQRPPWFKPVKYIGANVSEVSNDIPLILKVCLLGGMFRISPNQEIKEILANTRIQSIEVLRSEMKQEIRCEHLINTSNQYSDVRPASSEDLLLFPSINIMIDIPNKTMRATGCRLIRESKTSRADYSYYGNVEGLTYFQSVHQLFVRMREIINECSYNNIQVEQYSYENDIANKHININLQGTFDWSKFDFKFTYWIDIYKDYN